MLKKYFVLHILCVSISMQGVSYQKKTYACIFCEKLFDEGWKKNRHQLNYCKINPNYSKAFYRCSICNKKILKLTHDRHEQSLYHQKKLAYVHPPTIETHEGQYVCKYKCGQTFHHKRNRKSHELYFCKDSPSLNEKYYQCQYCNIIVKNKFKHLKTQKHIKNIEKNCSTKQDILKQATILSSTASSTLSDQQSSINHISCLPTITPLELISSNEEELIDNIPMPEDITTIHISTYQ